MAQMGFNGSDKIEFSFESDVTASFLVIKCSAEVLDYQAMMLGSNRIKHVFPVDILAKEGVTCIYYNITSMVSLSFLLNRRKLGREEFLRLLLSIAGAVADSGGYLLSESNFILSPEYIYVNPENLEPELVYVPARLEDNGVYGLQSFVSDLVLQHINADGFSSGNIVQRILASVKSEAFSIKGLIALLGELLYGQECEGAQDAALQATGLEPDAGILCANNETKDARTARTENRGKMEEIEEKDKRRKQVILESRESQEKSGKEKYEKHEEQKKRGKKNVVFAVAAQFAIGGIIYLCRGFLNNTGSNSAATYAAVVMLVLAAEILILKKLDTVRLIKLAVQQTQEERVKPGQVKAGHVKEEQEQTGEQADHAREWQEQMSRLREMQTPAGWLQERPVWERQGHEGKSQERQVWEKQHKAEQGKIPVDQTVPEWPGKGEEIIPTVASETLSDQLTYRTELLRSNSRGVRLLESTGRHSRDKDIVIDKDDFIIGRLAGQVDHVIKNNAVGKLHAQLIYRDGVSYVKDLNSVNGTFLNNKRLESNKEFELKENDRLQFANSEFIFICG